MEDIMIVEYLKDKGMITDIEYKDIKSRNMLPSHHIEEHYSDTHADLGDYNEFFKSFKKITKSMKDSEKDEFLDSLKDYNNKGGDHFTEAYAKFTVANMWHTTSKGEKCMGEVYDIHKAKEIHTAYLSSIPQGITCWDIYVAINALYHDYSCLFYGWFGNNIDQLIIDSAMTFWFKDDDYAEGFKLWNYFKK